MTDKTYPIEQINTLSGLIKFGVDESLKNVHTSLPGIIESFDPVTQTVSVNIAIKKIFQEVDSDSEFKLIQENVQTVNNVPICYPNAGGFYVTFPIKKGDECLLVFAERAFDYWQEFGGIQEPASYRRHDFTEAIAVLGITSKPNNITGYDTDAVSIRNKANTTSIKINNAGDVTITTANSTTVLDHSGNLTLTTTTGDCTFNCKNFHIVAEQQVNITAPTGFNVTAVGGVNVTSPQSTFSGDVTAANISIGSGGGAATINGTIHSTGAMSSDSTVSGSQVTAGGITLTNHTHISNGDGNPTSGPSG